MATVMVDVADLEKIVFATAIIKNIEGALTARMNDPFVRPHLDFSDAHERLATAMRNARRAQADTLIKFDAPLTDEERKLLRSIADTEGGRAAISFDDKIPDAGKDMSVVDQLAAKGCVVLGQCVTGVVWAGDGRPEIMPDVRAPYAAKMTARGYEKLKDVS